MIISATTDMFNILIIKSHFAKKEKKLAKLEPRNSPIQAN